MCIRDRVWPFRQSEHIWVDTEITPAYCTKCKKQVKGFFAYRDNKKEGMIGNFLCNYCNGQIQCMRSTYFRNQIIMRTNCLACPSLKIDFSSLYCIHPITFMQVKKETGYDLFEQGQVLKLSSIIRDICQRISLPETRLSSIPIITDLRFPFLPMLVNRWINLLRQLRIT
jgi:hypothetical protein